MALREYSQNDVVVIAGGIAISGFADGEAISIERASEDFTTYVGNDGETTRAATNNGLARATITLAQSSESNQYLTGLLLGKSVFPVMIKDQNGGSIYASEQAYIERQPTASFARDVGTREWILVMPDLVWNEGGNNLAG